MNTSIEELLVKNEALCVEMKRMEREHEETMKELLQNNDELAKQVNQLEQRNNELFERCSLLNKNRFINLEQEKENQKLDQEMRNMKRKNRANYGFVSELADYCYCSICCVVYDSKLYIPRMLWCGHTFCDLCIENVRYTDPDRIKCPMCTSVFETNLRPPVNYLLKSMVEEAMTLQSKFNNSETVIKESSQKPSQLYQESRHSMNAEALEEN